MHTYDWFRLRFDRKQQNSVKQLSFNKKINFKNKIKLQKKKIAGRNINNLRYTHYITLKAENKEELKSLLKKVKKESENVGLKVNIQKSKIMASGPIT